MSSTEHNLSNDCSESDASMEVEETPFNTSWPLVTICENVLESGGVDADAKSGDVDADVLMRDGGIDARSDNNDKDEDDYDEEEEELYDLVIAVINEFQRRADLALAKEISI
uniref:Uncharacterized protein n=1 Tax=Caenorhabditis japonica TaxID=281687 RepID=A0A8R1IHC3_CAEJA